MPAQHEPETLLANILAEVRSATTQIDQRDTATRSRLSNLEAALNDVMKRQGRPGGGYELGDVDGRKSALGLLEQKYWNGQPRSIRRYRRRAFPKNRFARRCWRPRASARCCIRPRSTW